MDAKTKDARGNTTTTYRFVCETTVVSIRHRARKSVGCPFNSTPALKYILCLSYTKPIETFLFVYHHHCCCTSKGWFVFLSSNKQPTYEHATFTLQPVFFCQSPPPPSQLTDAPNNSFNMGKITDEIRRQRTNRLSYLLYLPPTSPQDSTRDIVTIVEDCVFHN